VPRFAVVVAAMAMGAVLSHGCGDDGGEPHFLAGPGSDGQWYSVAANVAPDEAMTFGTQLTVSPTGGKELKANEQLTLKSVRLVGRRGIEMVGVSVSGPNRQFGIVGSKPGYPPPEASDDPLALPGAPVPLVAGTERGVAILIGVRRSTPGRGQATGIEVVYEAGGRTHRQVFRTGLALCATSGYIRGDDAGRCEPVPEPEDW